jgi:hypothetical protein
MDNIATRLAEIDKANATNDNDARLSAWSLAVEIVMSDYPPFHVWPDELPCIRQGDASDAETATTIRRGGFKDWEQLASTIADALVSEYEAQLSVEITNASDDETAELI